MKNDINIAEEFDDLIRSLDKATHRSDFIRLLILARKLGKIEHNMEIIKMLKGEE